MAKMYEFLCALMVFLTRTNAKVLLVSMDGFRWDYINKAATPNFDRMAQRRGEGTVYQQHVHHQDVSLSLFYCYR